MLAFCSIHFRSFVRSFVCFSKRMLCIIFFCCLVYLRAIILFSICTQTMSVVNDAFNSNNKKTEPTEKSNKTYKAEWSIKNHFEQNEENEKKAVPIAAATTLPERLVCVCAFFFHLFLVHFSSAYMTVSILIAHYIFHVVCSATVSLLLFVRYSFFSPLLLPLLLFHATSE